MVKNIVTFIVPDSFFGERADIIISKSFPQFSRSRIKKWIEDGHILIDGNKINPKKKLFPGESIVVNPQDDDREVEFQPEDIDFQVIYVDDDIAVINKPAGLVVHPADGNWSGTLLNGILYKFPNNKFLPRAGIVHRLDKDTSGLLVIGLNESSQKQLIEQLQKKTVHREYRAIVWGNIYSNVKIDEPIGRHPTNRVKMAINNINGKHAVTHITPLENFKYHSYIKCLLETGRTHQIRVHMNHNKTPIIGDPVYGFKKIIPMLNGQKPLTESILGFNRQALHAKKIGITHPRTKKQMNWETSLPEDIESLLNILRQYTSFELDQLNKDFD